MVQTIQEPIHNYNLPILIHHQHSSGAASEQTFSTDCDYFTYIPSVPSDHWSTETPIPSPNLPAEEIVADPHNPFLAARISIPLLSPPQSMDASKLMQLQSAAAHGQSPKRPKPQPHQDVLELSDDSSSGRTSISSEASSSGSRSHSSSLTSPKICSRCQKNYGQFVMFSLNSYYCTRCAKLVGYGG